MFLSGRRGHELGAAPLSAPVRSSLTLLVAAVWLVCAVPNAQAHTPVDVLIAAPAPGERVDPNLVVELRGQGLLREVATFRLLLDGEPVDVTGRHGAAASLFQSHRLASDQVSRLRLTVSTGPHELRVVYADDGDGATPDVVRRFTATGPGAGIGAEVLFVLGVGVVTPAVMVAARRRRRPQPDPPGANGRR